MELPNIKTLEDLELFIKSRDSKTFSDTLKEGQLYYIVQYYYNVRCNEFTGIKFIPEKLCGKKAYPDDGLFYGSFNNIYLTGILGNIILPAGVIPNCYIFENICDASKFANIIINIGQDAIKILEKHNTDIAHKFTQKMLSDKYNHSTSTDENCKKEVTIVDHKVIAEQMKDLAKHVGDTKESLFGVDRNMSWEDIINKESDAQPTWDELLTNMKKLQSEDDVEYAHATADEILCQALEHFGQHELVDAWKKVKKYYA